jgi:hypothetical protein
MTNVVPAPGALYARRTVPVVEYVNIISAAYSVADNSLTITATSGAAVAPTLTVSGFGAMTLAAGTYSLGPVTLTTPLPPSITVNSSAGGTDTTSVVIAP